MQEHYAQRFWQDHVADTLDAIAYGLAHVGGKGGGREFTPYSEYAHRSTRKRAAKQMTYDEIVQAVIDKM